MTEPGIDAKSDGRQNYRRNYLLGLANGALFMGGTSFVDPSTVLSAFILNFTDSRFLVGLAGSLQRMGWSLPQLLVSNWVERLRYKKPFYMVSNVIRMVLFFGVVFLIYFAAAAHPRLMLVGFLLLFGIGSLLGGGAGLCFTDIVGRILPPRKVGRFYAMRFLLGAGVMGILAGLCVRFILRRNDLFPFPTNYVVLFAAAFVLMAAGIACFCLVREPPVREVSKARPLTESLAQIPGLLRADPNFRTMLLSRFLLAGRGLSLMLYTALALQVFEVPAAAVGTFLMVKQGAGMLANVWWAKVSERAGNRAVIRLAAAGQLLVAVYALALVWLAGPLMALISGSAGRTALFLPIFALLGVTIFGEVIGYTSFAINITPEARRPTYIGLMNTVMGISGLFLALGGVLADLRNFHLVFALTLLLNAVGLAFANRLRDTGQERPL